MSRRIIPIAFAFAIITALPAFAMARTGLTVLSGDSTAARATTEAGAVRAVQTTRRRTT
jgi:hypothetical protein